jgi:hypothetical protein
VVEVYYRVVAVYHPSLPDKCERRGNEKHITAEWCGVSRGVVAQHIGALASAAMEVYD